MNKYLLQFVFTAISVKQNDVKNIESFVSSTINKYLNKSTELSQSIVLKETEYPIVNDRLIITAVLYCKTLSEDDTNNLKVYLDSELKNYLSNQSLIYKSDIISIVRI